MDLEISKNLSGIYTQTRIEHTKQSTTYALKTSPKRVIQKATEATGDLIGNKLANRITKFSRSSQHFNSETIAIEHDKEIPK